MKSELFAVTAGLIIITVSLTDLSVLTTIYGQEFNNSASTYGNMTKFAYTGYIVQ